MSKWRRLLPLVWLTVVFALPILLSWWFLHHSDYVASGEKSNYGTLLTPPRPLADQPLTGMGVRVAETVLPRHLHGRWSLLYFVPARCDESCRRVLHLLHQIEQALGKDSLRVQRVVHYVPDTAGMVSPLRGVPRRGPRGRELPPAWPGQWRPTRPVEILRSVVDVGAGGVYLIDPLGNLMMRYPPDFEPAGITRDLRHLLRVSPEYSPRESIP